MNRTNGLRLGIAVLALIAAPLAAQAFSEGYTFLKAVRERDGAAAERILSNPSSAAVNARDSGTGEGALHILVRGRDLNWLSFMLSRGARPDAQNNDGATPLILAAQIGWADGAQELLARRANPNLGNRRGETPLIFAVQTRDIAMVRVLLAGRANPSQTDHVSGNSALDYARQDARSAQILRLLEQAATPRPANAMGPTR
ncbi:MAG TPA: ankyrin repeat domain-containing protein [Allosphingosinicella sp.]|nr:ankyrin repeat domain-containing protein [Allosphingosinicella sp.]